MVIVRLGSGHCRLDGATLHLRKPATPSVPWQSPDDAVRFTGRRRKPRLLLRVIRSRVAQLIRIKGNPFFQRPWT